MTKLSENDCALIRSNPFYRNDSFVDCVDALIRQTSAQQERK